jgi:glycosyltransferase involved in cell wall biosynthesis
LRRHIRELSPDLVHSFLFDANVYSRIAALGLAIPILNSERNHGYSLNWAQALIHYLTRHLADAVIANSFAGELFARQLFGFDESRTHTVWNGIDLARIDARMAAATTPYRQLFFGSADIRLAVFVGAIKAQKDPLLALAVAEQLIDTDPRWRVAFVGASLDMSRVGYATTSGAESATLTEQVAIRWQASPHRDQIAFVGQREDAVEIIAAADVLFSTSHHEGFPNVVLEAMAVGTPVVSTIYSDIELILPADLLVHNRDAAAITAAITRVAAHRDQIGPALRAWVEARATIEYSADQMIRIYASHVEAARQT